MARWDRRQKQYHKENRVTKRDQNTGKYKRIPKRQRKRIFDLVDAFSTEARFISPSEIYSVAVDLLSKIEFQIFDLYYHKNVPLRQIAKRVDLSKSSVANRVRTIREKVRKLAGRKRKA